MQDSHITVKELMPIVLAAEYGAGYMEQKKYLAYCDNEAVVATMNEGDSQEECVHLMRYLAFFRNKFNFILYTQHNKD